LLHVFSIIVPQYLQGIFTICLIVSLFEDERAHLGQVAVEHDPVFLFLEILFADDALISKLGPLFQLGGPGCELNAFIEEVISTRRIVPLMSILSWKISMPSPIVVRPLNVSKASDIQYLGDRSGYGSG